MKNFGGHSMVQPIQSVLVRRPNIAFGSADPDKWHYSGKPDLGKALVEHDAFIHTIQKIIGAEIIYHDFPLSDHADAIYVHDPAIVCDAGAILMKMGKHLRQGEEDALGKTLEGMGIPIYYRLHGSARAEGGDLIWIDDKTLVIGQGFRTNKDGLLQLREALSPLNVEIIPVDLPYYRGPDACLHLMSFISIIDVDLAVVYLPLLPVPFWEILIKRGFRFVEVPEQEFLTMGPNVLAVAPGKCLMLEGNPVTQERLLEAGCEVFTYKGYEISLKGEGGATCLTRPILRV